MPPPKHSFPYFPGAILLLAVTALTAAIQEKPIPPQADGIVATNLETPISFEPNWGQTDGRVKFMARGAGYNLFLTPGKAVFFFRHGGSNDDLAPKESEVLAMNVVGANQASKMTGVDELPGKSSYFLSSDPRRWHTNLPNFGKVQDQDIYPGIDLVYHSSRGQLEYDFVVHPGAAPKMIAIEFTGAKLIKVNPQGALWLETKTGKISFHKPVVYQQEGENKRFVNGRYVLTEKNHIAFALGAYDSKKTLTIDPIFTYAGRRQASAYPHCLETLDHTVRDRGFVCPFPSLLMKREGHIW